MSTDLKINTDHLRGHGWVRIEHAIAIELCKRLVDVLEIELHVPIGDSSRWDAYGGGMQDLVPAWGHQAQWDIRQHPNLHRIWSTLLNTERLGVSLDSCRFTPPWKPGYAEPYGIHWDHDPFDAKKRMFQGVLALTDTTPNQGGFRCIPSLYHDRNAWPKTPHVDADGDENWLAGIDGREIVYVPARAGDLIIWDSCLPHSNSKNMSLAPRIAFYVLMGRREGWSTELGIESWRTGRCVPWWRSRPGYDRVEPWPPAQLTALGRKLLGLEEWP